MTFMRLKILGLAAVCTIFAASASTALAEEEAQFTAAEYPATIGGESTGPLVMTLANREVTCETFSLNGELSEASTTLTLAPEFSECHTEKIFGANLPVTITSNGCAYQLHATNEAGVHTAIGDLTCPEEGTLEVHFYLGAEHATPACNFDLPNQSGLETIELENVENEEEAADDVLATATINSISYTQTSGGAFICGVGESPTEVYEDGELEVTATLQANVEESPADFDITKTPVEFKAAQFPAELEGQSTGTSSVFNLQNERETTCKKSTFSGELQTVNGKTEPYQAEIKRTYEECETAIGGGKYPTTIKMTTCKFLLTGTERRTSALYRAHVDIACTSGGEIEILVFANAEAHEKEKPPMCTFTLPGQKSLGFVELENKPGGPKKDVVVTPNVSGMTAKVKEKPEICGEETNKAIYHGSTTMIAKKEGGQIDIAMGGGT